MLIVGVALGLWKLASRWARSFPPLLLTSLRQSHVGAHLFGSLYIGSWVYQPDDWTHMASQRYRRAVKVGSIIVLIFTFLCAMGAIVMCEPSHRCETRNLFDTR